jgi:phospholipid N-methyltransferase
MATHNPLVFFRRFLTSPKSIGAVMPSSIQLARTMAETIKPGDRVLEIGAGTGALTQSILERLSSPALLTSVEIDPELCREFSNNFPDVRLVTGDAEDILKASSGFDAIVSGIPFAVMEPAKRARMFSLIGERLNPGGRFVAFQYSLSSKTELERLFKDVRVKFAPINVPPAAVYVCSEPILGRTAA